MSIWKRYFYREFIVAILAFLFGIYALYILIDVMAHLKNVTDKHSTLSMWVEFYLATFSKRLDVLLPFSILLATVRTLCSLQSRGELVAMLASGISKKTLLSPFLVVSACCSLLVYANYEWALPSAIPKIVNLVETRFGKESLENEAKDLNEVMLNDGSKIIYSKYNSETKLFSNVFWIQSTDSIFHIKTLSLNSKIPTGKWVDHIARTASGALENAQSQELHEFTEMNFTLESLKNSVTPPNEQSLLQLLKQTYLYSSSCSPKGSEITATFLYKLTLPLMCLLAFIAPAPFCMRFSRSMPILMIYLIAIAALFCYGLVLQSAFSLGKSQVITPYLSIGLPWCIAAYFFGRKYNGAV
ncbi:MAG: hypothetical protein JWO53_1370 [Chlamydiia bacterium]|nr:hypothetical protein [Chlamydiia bacterium]